MELLDQLRESRKSPSVLKLRLIAIRSSSSDICVFCFEGDDDVPVYEEWLARIISTPVYEPLPGKGKEQLLAFREMLCGDPLGDRVFFFIDYDFDPDDESDNRTYNLQAYSIENVLCSDDVLESILIDEFRCAGSIEERRAIRSRFSEFISEFKDAAMPVHEILFICRREGLKIEKKPEHVRDFLNIEIDDVTRKFADVSNVITMLGSIDEKRRELLLKELCALPSERALRGKYLMQAFRLWLRTLVVDRSSANPRFFKNCHRVAGTPENFALRRLASRSLLPEGLENFIVALG